jgi:hypothetical protein
MAGHLKESDSLCWKHVNFPPLWTLYRALPPSPTFKTKPFLHLQQCFIWSKAFYVSQLWSLVGQFFGEEEQCEQASLILITPMEFHAQSQLLGLWMSIL